MFKILASPSRKINTGQDTERDKNREMTGRGTDEDSKSEAKTVIQKLLLFSDALSLVFLPFREM